MKVTLGLLAIAFVLAVIAWLIDCCDDAIPAILEEVDE
jgi:hypothetical protein